MAYLTGKTLEYFAAHLQSIEKAPGAQKRRLRIYADSRTAADHMANIVNSVFGGISYATAPEGHDNFAAVNFEYVWERNYAVEQVKKEVSRYRTGNQDSLLENLLADDDTDPPTEEEDEDGKKTDWTTYIIIGLAAVALILLVWPKRKK